MQSRFLDVGDYLTNKGRGRSIARRAVLCELGFIFMYLRVTNGLCSLSCSGCSGVAVVDNFHRTFLNRVVLQEKDFCINMEVDLGSRPGVVCGYTKCRVLHSRQHLHIWTKRCQAEPALERMGCKKLFYNAAINSFEFSNNVQDRAFIAFNLDLSLSLICLLVSEMSSQSWQ